MISLKKFLSSDHRETSEAYERMSYRLLHAIGLHAVEGDHADLNSFQATIAGVQTSLEGDPSPENVLVATGAAIEALQSYNRRTSLFIGAKSFELQTIVGMLTQAMSQITTGSQNSITRLHELQKEIEHAVMIEDVRGVKTRLHDCLQSIRGEVARQQDESNRVVADLKQGLHRSQQAKPDAVAGESDAAEPGDPVTGLPQRSDAKAAIAAVCEARLHVYAGLFVLDRIHAINSRFGHALGDRALVFFLQHLSQALEPADKLFRWDDTSFLALMTRRESADQVRKDLGRTLGRRMEQTFNIEGRSVTLPVSSTWVVTPLFEHTYAENLQKFDAFCESLHRS